MHFFVLLNIKMCNTFVDFSDLLLHLCCSVAKFYLTLWPLGEQHNRLPCPSPSPRICSNSCPLSPWCHPTISSSVTLFSSCPQSFPASASFPMNWPFTSVSQSIGTSASASVFPMNIQSWFPLGWTGGVSLQSRGLPRVFSHTTVQKHQIFGAQLSLWSNSHIHTWLLDSRILKKTQGLMASSEEGLNRVLK